MVCDRSSRSAAACSGHAPIALWSMRYCPEKKGLCALDINNCEDLPICENHPRRLIGLVERITRKLLHKKNCVLKQLAMEAYNRKQLPDPGGTPDGGS